MDTLLAIETCAGHGTISLSHGRKRYGVSLAGNTLAAQLVPCIEGVLSEAGIWYNDLTHVLATTGPGSFTGIRIGLATARAIGFSAQKPTYAMTTLECLAWQFWKQADANTIHAALPAGKGEMYLQKFEISEAGVKALSNVLFAKPDRLFEHVMGHEKIIGHIEPFIAPTDLARFSHKHVSLDASGLVFAYQTIGDGWQPALLSPTYIREPDAKIPTPKFSNCNS